MIGRNGERRSGISAPAARHDDDDTHLLLELIVLKLLDACSGSSSFGKSTYILLHKVVAAIFLCIFT